MSKQLRELPSRKSTLVNFRPAQKNTALITNGGVILLLNSATDDERK